MKGRGEDWFNEKIIPEYIKAGYPEYAKPEYGKWERAMKYVTDGKRHLVCLPYSLDNLHKMTYDLGIKRCWFHKDHIYPRKEYRR